MIVVEPVKLKELTNDSKDKENLSVFQKYFKNILLVKSILKKIISLLNLLVNRRRSQQPIFPSKTYLQHWGRREFAIYSNYQLFRHVSWKDNQRNERRSPIKRVTSILNFIYNYYYLFIFKNKWNEFMSVFSIYPY